jgi:hypothetical protein
MRVVRFALVLLAAFAISLSLALPAEDVPETPYDESESMPYESTPSVSIMPQESALAPKLNSPSQLHREAKRKMLAGRSEHESHPTCGSVITLDQTFRC